MTRAVPLRKSSVQEFVASARALIARKAAVEHAHAKQRRCAAPLGYPVPITSMLPQQLRQPWLPAATAQPPAAATPFVPFSPFAPNKPTPCASSLAAEQSNFRDQYGATLAELSRVARGDRPLSAFTIEVLRAFRLTTQRDHQKSSSSQLLVALGVWPAHTEPRLGLVREHVRRDAERRCLEAMLGRKPLPPHPPPKKAPPRAAPPRNRRPGTGAPEEPKTERRARRKKTRRIIGGGGWG